MTNKPDGKGQWWPPPVAIWCSVAGFIVVGTVALFLVPNLLLNEWLPDSTVEERSKLLGTAAQIVLVSLGGLVAIIGVGLSLSRHGQELKQAQRDIERLADDREKETLRRKEVDDLRRTDAEREMRARYVTAVGLLSDAERPTNRSAGLRALGALADDWDSFGKSDEVQACIDTICDYLRSVGPTSDDEAVVTEVGFGVLRAHLVDGAIHSWSDRPMILRGALIDTEVSLQQARLRGSGLLDFGGARILEGGRLRLHWAKLEDQAVIDLDRSTVEGGGISLDSAHLTGRSRIDMLGITVTRGVVQLASLRLDDGSTVNLNGGGFKLGSFINLDGLSPNEEARLYLPGARVDTEGVATEGGIFDDRGPVLFPTSGALSLNSCPVRSGTSCP